MTIKIPNYQVLGDMLGVSTNAAQKRFYKMKACFEADEKSPKPHKAVTPQKEKQTTPKRAFKNRPKKKIVNDSDDESEGSLHLESDKEPEESYKGESETEI